MPRFLTALDVTLVDPAGWVSRATWRLRSALIYESDLLRRRVTVPAGTLTDFASVPRVPFAFWLAGDSAHRSAVVHDWLYRTRDRIPRKTCDEVFREAMRVDGVPGWRRHLMYAAVRLFGGRPYRKRL